MPPEENKKNNGLPLGTFKIGIDPIFKNNQNLAGLNKSSPESATNPISSGAYNVLNNQKFTPTISESPAPSQQTQINNKTPNNKSIIRTFKSDMQSAILADHLSSINIAIAENEKMHNKIKMEQKGELENKDPSLSSEYSKDKIIIFISVILIIIGTAGIVATFFINKEINTPTVRVKEFPSLITTEYKDELNITNIDKNKLTIILSDKLSENKIPINGFSNIYITHGTSTEKKLITADEFISSINFGMPSIIKRVILPDYMIGSYFLDKNIPFIIFKVSSFENAYVGMLTWEKTLEKDIQILFRLPGYESSQGILDKLEPSAVKNFVDKIIVNKDTRLIKDESGQTILLYGIIDKETIIITTNEEAFKEIINRLNKEKTLKR